MAHLTLPWWPRTSSTTSSGGDLRGRGGSSATTTTVSTNSSSSSNCCGLSKLMRKLKKRSKMLHQASRQSSLQCRYDPMSYSLNFDRTGSGDFVDDDYYKFYAFSSRFVAAPRADCQRLVVVAH